LKNKLSLVGLALLTVSLGLIFASKLAVNQVAYWLLLAGNFGSVESMNLFTVCASVLGYALMVAGAGLFVALAVSTRFRVDQHKVVEQAGWLRRVFVVVAVLMVAASLVFTGQVQSNSTATTGYYLATPYSPYDWLISNYSTGLVYAINGSNWANMMTFPTPAPWAAHAGNSTAVIEAALAATTSGTIYLKGVNFNYSLTVPENVAVIENVNGLTRVFANSANSEGSPFTVSVDTRVSGYYMVADRMGRIISDWTSTNDTALRNTVYSNMVAGETLFFRKGAYTINGTTHVKSGTTTIGESENGVVFTASSDISAYLGVQHAGAGFIVDKTSNTTMRDFTVKMNYYGSGIYVNDSINPTFTGITIDQGKDSPKSTFATSGHDMVVSFNVTNLVVDDCLMTNGYDDCLQLGEESAYAASIMYYPTVTNSIFRDTIDIANHTNSAGIEVANSVGAVIEGNTVINRTVGIAFHGGQQSTFASVKNNKIYNSSLGTYPVSGTLDLQGIGILVQEIVQNSEIKDNLIDASASLGAYFSAGLVDCQVTGNTFNFSGQGATLPAPYGSGMVFGASKGNLISENTIEYSSYAAIELYGTSGLTGCSNNTVTKNIVQYNQKGIYLRYGFNNTISENEAHRNTMEGIVLYFGATDGGNNLFKNNIVTMNTNEGIKITHASNNATEILESNVIQSNGRGGIELWELNNATVTKNYCENNGQNTVSKAGIYLRNCNNTIVTYNTMLDNQAVHTQAYGFAATASSGNSTGQIFAFNVISGWGTAAYLVNAGSTNYPLSNYISGTGWTDTFA
jgi:parallel beta-helix repeat protein